MDLLKKLTHHHDHKTDKDHKSDGSSSPAHSTTSNEDPAAHAKYLNDPMRTTTHGDSVGHFVDPMGGKPNTAANYDPTNTGA
ncbi:hypothetical protein [Absidia glauca]|uniref:Uncharacterized protein n=1 Tax=Absidia glauca TaxID=4829 RepID=A0A163MX14_ABSGL|nr:hypothetical protein [Absidia glauca]